MLVFSKSLQLHFKLTCSGLGVPRTVADPFARSGEAVRLSYAAGSPILLKLPDRQWGPSLSLSAREVEDIAGMPFTMLSMHACRHPHMACK